MVTALAIRTYISGRVTGKRNHLARFDSYKTTHQICAAIVQKIITL